MSQNKYTIHSLNETSTNVYHNTTKNLFSLADLNLDWYYILPEICLLNISILCLMVVGMANFAPQATILEKKQKITPIIRKITNQGLLVVVAILYFMSIKNSQICFNAYIIIDFYSMILKCGVVFSTLVILLCSSTYLYRHSRALMEFPILITLTIFFLFILLSSYNLFSMFISIIGFSLNIYVLLLTDCMNKSSREAAIKYYYLSTISTGLIAGGILMAYLLFHTTNFLTITWILHCWTASGTIESAKVLLSTMIYFIIIGFLFKLAAFPCHLWAPEIYDGAPHPITAFFILPIKIATFGIFLRLLTYVFNDLHFIWTHLIWIASVMSMLWGAFAALVEMRIKRFMAYSSINQMGFLLIGLVCGTFEGIRSSLIFLAIYVITNLAFFIIFLTTRDTKSGRSLTYLTDLQNFAIQNRLLSTTFVVIFFSMAGIPPLAGFFGKFYLLLHAFENGYYLLVIVGLLTSLLSTFYYLRLIKIMWFEEPPTTHVFFNFITTLTVSTRIIHNLLEMLLISFIIWSPLLINFINLVTYSCVMPLTHLF